MKAAFHGLVLAYALLTIFFGVFEINPKFRKDNKNINITSNEEEVEVKFKRKYYENRRWVSNGNVTQYSSYLITDNSTIYSIETVILILNDSFKNDLACILYFLSSNKTIELQISELYDLKSGKQNFKAYCEYRALKELNLTDVLVAVIRKEDFNLTKKSKLHKIIDFQIPDKIVKYENLLNSVALCVPYADFVPNNIQGWIKLHRSFRFMKIVVYDATNGQKLIHAVVNETDLVDLIQIHDSTSSVELTSNDCLTALSKTFKYVAVYNLDEYIFPRNANINGRLIKCNDFKGVCESQPFSAVIYDYVENLIEKSRVNKSEVNSIRFNEAFYLYPNYIEKQLFVDLKSLIDQYDKRPTRQNQFPMKLLLDENIFLLNKTDINNTRYLIDSYEVFKCLYNNYLKDNIENLDLMRHLYVISHGSNSRFIYLSQNIKTIHQKKSVSLHANPLNGHIASIFHNRKKQINSASSIENLNIDFEYVFYLLINKSNFCSF